MLVASLLPQKHVSDATMIMELASLLSLEYTTLIIQQTQQIVQLV